MNKTALVLRVRGLSDEYGATLVAFKQGSDKEKEVLRIARLQRRD